MGLLELQLERLQARIDGVTMRAAGETGWVVRIAEVPLPNGWSKSCTAVSFVAPQGYPFAKPDCFWTDPDLRLVGGTMPKNTQINNPIPGLPDSLLWFSWHVDPWNPNRDDFVTWFTLIKNRLARPE